MAIATTKTYTLDFDGYWREVNCGGVPAQSGVYTVYACTYDPNAKTVSIRELVYIGESGDARARIGEHLAGVTGAAWKRRRQSGEVLCFGFAPIGSLDRERVEAALIYKHKPPTNTQCVNDFPYGPTRVKSSGRTAKLNTDFTVG